MILAGALDPLVPFAAVAAATRADRAPRVDDQEAVLACQRGEREAFGRLVERYQRDVYRLCYRYVDNHQDANDMAQEVFLRAYRAIDKFRGDSSFSTWIYRIAVNTCLNFRSQRRPESEPLEESLPDGSRSAADDVLRRERARIVRGAVARLPERQRATLILKVYHDLTHEEVAEVLGSSVGTVKANLFHAMGNLRKLLADGPLAADAERTV